MTSTQQIEPIRAVHDLPEIDETIMLLVDCYRKDTLEDMWPEYPKYFYGYYHPDANQFKSNKDWFIYDWNSWYEPIILGWIPLGFFYDHVFYPHGANLTPDYDEDTFQCVWLGGLDICMNCSHCVNRGMIGDHRYYFCNVHNIFVDSEDPMCGDGIKDEG